MPKKSCFRRPFDKEGDKRAQALIKSASQNLYHIHWSLPSLYSWKRSLLLTCQILGLLLNTLLADRVYLVLHRNNLTVEIQMELSQKQKTFSQFLVHFWNLSEILVVLKKKMTFIDFLFPKLRTPKTWLDKCLKGPVSEDPSRSGMVNVNKHCSNLHRVTFIKVIDHCQVTWVGKNLSYWHGKFRECFLTHWLPIKCILVLRETI